MLACGTECQPTTITREIQLFPSSCRAAKVATDVADGFIKGIGNPGTSSAMISELLAAELGTWFELRIPPFAVVRDCPIDIPMKDREGNLEGYISPPVFFSKAVDGIPRDGSDRFLKRLETPSDVARLVVFDTWILNNDRYVDGSENSDNLLYAQAERKGKYDLVVIDHSHCFVDQPFEIDLPGKRLPQLLQDTTVYGRYPEFTPFITEDDVNAAINKLAELERDFVVECVNQIPAEWGLAAALQIPLVDFVCGRAAFVVDLMRDRFISNPRLPFDGQAS
jgi:hypothetical protein